MLKEAPTKGVQRYEHSDSHQEMGIAEKDLPKVKEALSSLRFAL